MPVEDLERVLTRAKALVERSTESAWTPCSPAKIAGELEVAIAKLDDDERFDAHHLSMLFAPTGPIQEIAIASGWTEEYLALSREFDTLIQARLTRR